MERIGVSHDGHPVAEVLDCRPLTEELYRGVRFFWIFRFNDYRHLHSRGGTQKPCV